MRRIRKYTDKRSIIGLLLLHGSTPFSIKQYSIVSLLLKFSNEACEKCSTTPKIPAPTTIRTKVWQFFLDNILVPSEVVKPERCNNNNSSANNSSAEQSGSSCRSSFLLVKPSEWAKLDVGTPSSFKFLYEPCNTHGETQSILTSQIMKFPNQSSSQDRSLWIQSKFGQIPAQVGDIIEVKTETLQSMDLLSFGWNVSYLCSESTVGAQTFTGIVDFIWCAGSLNSRKVRSNFVPSTICQDHYCNVKKSRMSPQSRVLVNFLTKKFIETGNHHPSRKIELSARSTKRISPERSRAVENARRGSAGIRRTDREILPF